MPLETDRLLLRRPRLADAPDLFGFLGDAEAMRYTLRFASLRDCRRHLAAHERQRRRVGCAPWVVLSRADGRVVGYGGLFEDPFDRGWGIEVGYFFARWAWGRGYATELTRFCLDVARERLGLVEVAAFAHPDNVASRRVLEKAGFEVERFVPAMGRYLYRRRLTPSLAPSTPALGAGVPPSASDGWDRPRGLSGRSGPTAARTGSSR